MANSQYNYGIPHLDTYDVRTPVISPKPKTHTPTDTKIDLSRLDPRALKLLRELPAQFQLLNTARLYPHLINQLAAAWYDEKALNKFIDSLLIDERGGRIGFQFCALDELCSARDYRVEQLTGRRQK